MNDTIHLNANTEFETKLIQERFNVNVAFYIHLKQFELHTRKELKEKIEEVFFFSKSIEWKFDSFGIEKQGSREKDIIAYFIFRTCNIKKLQKLFKQEFNSYDNAIKITCSVAKYEKIEESFFELEV